jgi:hypothetical protein
MLCVVKRNEPVAELLCSEQWTCSGRTQTQSLKIVYSSWRRQILTKQAWFRSERECPSLWSLHCERSVKVTRAPGAVLAQVCETLHSQLSSHQRAKREQRTNEPLPCYERYIVRGSVLQRYGVRRKSHAIHRQCSYFVGTHLTRYRGDFKARGSV